MTQASRAVLADPRVAAGFHPEWKEIVYLIVTVRSEGSEFRDVDDNIYIDLLNGFGPTPSASVSVRHS
jgi:glutamate-1-semialdehyde aminotransferase